MNAAKIEGAVIDVCEKCSRFGTKVDAVQNPAAYTAEKTIKIPDIDTPHLELVADYGKLVVKLRESKGMTRYDFAQRISEKESVVKRLEDQDFEPDESLIKKIENFLDVKLTERLDGAFVKQRQKKIPDLTVGDVIDVS